MDRANRSQGVAKPSVTCIAIVATLTLCTSASASGLAVSAARAPAHPAGGALIWEARDAGPNRAFDDFGGMAISPDGSTVYVARSSNGVYVVVAHDASTGAARWTVRTKGSNGAQIFAHAAAMSATSKVAPKAARGSSAECSRSVFIGLPNGPAFSCERPSPTVQPTGTAGRRRRSKLSRGRRPA